MNYDYDKKSIWKWILLYVIIGAVAYGLIFYLSYPKYWGYNNYQNQTKQNVETADWEVYRNNKYSYEIKYPKDWRINKLSTLDLEFSLGIISPGKNSIEKEDGADINFELVSKTRQIDSVDVGLAERIKQMRSIVKPKTKIKIGNYDGYEVIGTLCTSICTGSSEDTYGLFSIIYFSKDGLVFEIQYLEGIGGIGAKEKIQDWKYYDEYKEILSTFKFTDSQNEITDWKTYRNDEYGFEIKYPSGWTFRQYEALGGGTSIGFQPLSKPDEPKYEFIEFDVFLRSQVAGKNICDIPFSEYVKTAYVNETGVRNDSLAFIQKVANVNNVVAYKTTWKDNDTPITYFDTKDCTSIRAFMRDTNYTTEYNQMIENFKFIK